MMKNRVLWVFAFLFPFMLLHATQRPVSGFVFNYKLGDFTFYSLVNNSGKSNENLIANKDVIDINKYKAAGWDGSGINYFLLDTGKHKVLFDTGHSAERNGKIIARLEEVGFTPADIDILCLTHMHSDHIGGMLDAEGKKVFPNAKVFISKEEAAYWNDASQAANPCFQNARQVLKAYADSIILFPQKATIIKGVESITLFGHTPGHTGFSIISKGQQIIVWGDVIHFGIQFANPDIYLTYDVYPQMATQSRKRILKKTADRKTAIAGMHLVSPGMGKVKKGKTGYQFEAGI